MEPSGPASTAEPVVEIQMKTSRIGLMVLVLLLLAFVVATPTAFAEALLSDGGSGGSSTAGWSPLAVILGAAGAAVATIATASYYLHRR